MILALGGEVFISYLCTFCLLKMFICLCFHVFLTACDWRYGNVDSTAKVALKIELFACVIDLWLWFPQFNFFLWHLLGWTLFFSHFCRFRRSFR
jgi:hypothetical protein